MYAFVNFISPTVEHKMTDAAPNKEFAMGVKKGFTILAAGTDHKAQAS